jgi:putative oxidoreductase
MIARSWRGVTEGAPRLPQGGAPREDRDLRERPAPKGFEQEQNATMNDAIPPKGPSKGLHISLWVGQVVLAVMFAMAGVMKLTTPIDELARKLAWAGALPAPMVRFIGLSELAGALGLVLPAALRIRPRLTPLAAAGLAAIMVFAVFFHSGRGELEALPINLFLGGLAAFVAWGRYRKAPIAPKP